MNKKLTIVSATLLLLPLLAFAQPMPGSIPHNITLKRLIGTVGCTALSILWYVAIIVVVVMFVLAGLKFLTAQGNPGKVAEARQAVLWGVIGTIVVVLAWSVTKLVGNEIGVLTSYGC